MPKFIPGLDLAEGFYRDIVAPILAKEHPNLPYSAALIGDGSEVIGFDTEMSTDHLWGPRLQLFLSEDCDVPLKKALHQLLASHLPHKYRGYPTNFRTPSRFEPGVQQMAMTSDGPVNHLVEITTLKEFSQKQMGVDATRPLTEDEWLGIPQQQLLSMTAGRVFRDDVGLGDVRKQLEWYPRDLWLFLLGCTWWRFHGDEKAVGRAGMASDELGAGIIASRIVRDLMRLAFCMERKYTPYAKWLGGAFDTLDVAPKLGPHLNQVMRATTWLERDMALSQAYVTVAEMHNALGVTKPIQAKTQLFRDRPFHVISAIRFGRALFEQVQSRRLSQLFKQRLYGNIDLITDSNDTLRSAVKQGRILRAFGPD